LKKEVFHYALCFASKPKNVKSKHIAALSFTQFFFDIKMFFN